MNCIIVDDEPLAREAVELLIKEDNRLKLIGNFNSAKSASEFMENNTVDLIFLDVQMPHINGIEFARTISKNTLVIFTTAYSDYALDSYDVEAIDYLIKPVENDRFKKAVDKALIYHSLLIDAEKENVEGGEEDYIFVKSERKYFKVYFDDILFVEGLKDYVIIQTENKKIITKMFLRTINELLPEKMFFRINKSYIVNLKRIESFDNNDVFIGTYEIAIGNTFRSAFFKKFMSKNM